MLGMNIRSLTMERVEKLKSEMTQKREELDVLLKTTPEQLWEHDLDVLSAALDDMEEELAQDALQEAGARKRARKRSRNTKKKASKNKC